MPLPVSSRPRMAATRVTVNFLGIGGGLRAPALPRAAVICSVRGGCNGGNG